MLTERLSGTCHSVLRSAASLEMGKAALNDVAFLASRLVMGDWSFAPLSGWDTGRDTFFKAFHHTNPHYSPGLPACV